jgi:hypothetical protein
MEAFFATIAKPLHHQKKKHWSIAPNIKIKKIIDRDLLHKAEADLATTVIVGPATKSYHAYFLEHGWRSGGKRTTIFMTRGQPKSRVAKWQATGYPGVMLQTRRIASKGRLAQHSRQGTSQYTWNPGKGYVATIGEMQGPMVRAAMLNRCREYMKQYLRKLNKNA